MQVRGVTASLLADSLERLPSSEWPKKESDDILKAVAKLISDNTPDARNAAKKIISLLQTAYDYQVQLTFFPYMSQNDCETEGKQNPVDC